MTGTIRRYGIAAAGRPGSTLTKRGRSRLAGQPVAARTRPREPTLRCEFAVRGRPAEPGAGRSARAGGRRRPHGARGGERLSALGGVPGEHRHRRVRGARRGRDRRQPDLIVLDRMLPGHRRRGGLPPHPARRRRCPIILLTALGSTEDRIVGLEAGADDYLTKPFSPRELVLRVQSILRRSVGDLTPEAPFELGPFALDPSARIIRKDGARARPLGARVRPVLVPAQASAPGVQPRAAAALGLALGVRRPVHRHRDRAPRAREDRTRPDRTRRSW